MSSEGAQSVSSSIKRGFCAPLIKKDAGGEKATTQTSEKKMAMKAGGEKTAAQTSGKKIEAKKISVEGKNDSGGQKTTKQNSEKKRETKTKPQTPLTDSQYEDIFQSVLRDTTMLNNTSGENVSKNGHIETENTPLCNEQENTPCNEQENTPSCDVKVGLKRSVSGDLMGTPPPTKRSKSEASPWGSHFNKHLSQASSIVKDMVESQNSLMNSSALLSPATSSGEGVSEEEGGQWSQRSFQLSQRSLESQPRATDTTDSAPKEDQRSRLENLQRLRNVGLWVFCCRPSCQKQRYLADVTDPQEVPEIWYCHMNPDVKYNSCLKTEQTLSAEEEADMIYNEFTAGSVVWARVQGYPWWPAMVDDDPDLEQYYWLLEDDITVTHYHVVFFDDNEVTRAWVALKDISSFSKNENKYKQKSTRGIDYSRRLRVSKEQAREALAMTTSQRLSAYSFIARYKGPISTSAKKVKDTMTKYKLKRIAPKITNKEEFKTKTHKKDIEKKTREPRAKDEQIASKTKSKEKAEVGSKIKNTKRNNKNKNKEETGNGPQNNLENVEQEESAIKISRPKKSKEDNISKELDHQLSDKPDGKNEKLKPAMFEKYSMKKSQNSAKINAVKASKASPKNSNHIETSNIEDENKKHIDEIVLNGPINEMIDQNPSGDQQNTNVDIENDFKNGHQTHLAMEKEPLINDSVMTFDEEKEPQLKDSVMMVDREKEPQGEDSVMKFNGEKEPQINDSVMTFDEEKAPQLEDSLTMFDSETPSHIDVISQKSTSSDRALKPPEAEDDTLGSVIEPTDNLVVAPPNSQVLSPECCSQSAIANYMANESDDAVVPYAFDLSQPFEE